MAGTKYILEQIKIEGVLQDLLAKSNGENVQVTYNGTSQTLTAALAAILSDIGTKASSTDLSTVSGKVSTLIGSDNDKSARVIAGEVLAAAGKLERKKVNSVADIDPTAEHADEFIYMVPKTKTESGDEYDEYMVIDGKVERVGDWKVDLSDYLTKVTGATQDDIAVLNTDGTLKDGGKKLSDFVEKETGKGLSANDYSDAEKQKVADAYADRHTHTNKTVLDGITAEKVAAWDGIRGVRYGTEAPADMQNGELFVRVVSE